MDTPVQARHSELSFLILIGGGNLGGDLVRLITTLLDGLLRAG